MHSSLFNDISNTKVYVMGHLEGLFIVLNVYWAIRPLLKTDASQWGGEASLNMNFCFSQVPNKSVLKIGGARGGGGNAKNVI